MLQRYEIKILDLDVVPTFESRRAVWTRIITCYAYQKDFKNAPKPNETPSEFVKVMELAEEILEAAGKGKFPTCRLTARPSSTSCFWG